MAVWRRLYKGGCTKVALSRWLYQGGCTNVAVPRWRYSTCFFIHETLEHNILLSVNFFTDDFFRWAHFWLCTNIDHNSALFVIKWSQCETSGNDLIHIHRSDMRNNNLVVNILSFKYSHRRLWGIVKSYFYPVKEEIKTIGKLRLTFSLLFLQRREASD